MSWKPGLASRFYNAESMKKLNAATTKSSVLTLL
jgi:hypothetical protein